MQTKVVNPKEVKAKGKRAKARTLCPCHKNCVANAIEMQPGTQSVLHLTQRMGVPTMA
jgi:hypothetical protein